MRLFSLALLVLRGLLILGASKNENGNKEKQPFTVKITFSDQDWYQTETVDDALTLLPGGQLTLWPSQYPLLLLSFFPSLNPIAPNPNSRSRSYGEGTTEANEW